ncbi:MAG: DUF4013 domain-containing protein [Methanothermobacter sp.]|jgi:hypothetical protein
MDAGQITTNALKYPSTNFKKVIILGILTILSSLIIPGFLVLGYALKIVKSSMKGANELPNFNQWLEMFVDGLKVFVVLFIYSLVPVILVLLGTWAIILPMLSVPGSGSIFNTSFSVNLIGGIAFIGIAIEVVVSFILPIALANMVHHDKLVGAFRFGEIINKIKQLGPVDYLIWYIMMLIIALVFGYISTFLVFPLIIGVIIVPLLIMPYLIIFYARSTSLAYTYEVSGHEYYRHSKQIDEKK